MEKSIIKPSILPGFMELLPEDQITFNWMMDIIRKNYERFGFAPIDTPAIEKSEILLAKGGGDTAKQVYKVSNNGDTDMSMRFDLTVPLARYVAQHYSDLNFPFRRYHIAKVYRGERNQKGRFREFYQADIDVIGNGSLSIINDAEIPSVIYNTFKELGFENFTIKINNRKILSGFFESLGIEEAAAVLRIIDKMDKIGTDAVKEELAKANVTEIAIGKIMEFIAFKGTKSEIFDFLETLNIPSSLFKSGVAELKQVVDYIEKFGVPNENFIVDLTIARGLDYYTGTVYETMLNDYPAIGSVCSGGRYDNLAENYTKQKLPGVGISIGLSRLFYQLREAGMILFRSSATLSKALIVPFEGFMDRAVELSTSLRNQGIVCEVFFEEGKIAKKFNYADKQGIEFVITIGENEANSGTYAVKNMKEGTQEPLDLNKLIELLK